MVEGRGRQGGGKEWVGMGGAEEVEGGGRRVRMAGMFHAPAGGRRDPLHNA